MEAYKTTCPDCEHVRFWVGYKTGLGKTPEQLKQMQKEETTCVGCGSKRAKTGLDFESETGKEFGESANFLVQMIAEIINENKKKEVQKMESNLVYVALLGGRVGYFATEGEVPKGWRVAPPMLDITDVMRANGLTKAQALELMNR